MDLKSKFNLGDRVFDIGHDMKTVKTDCLFCAGDGTIHGADGTVDECPRCYGAGHTKTYEPAEWRVREDVLTVGQVRICAGIAGANEETYICTETGIGSGSVYDVNRLFASKEEAQAEADKRNEENPNGTR